MTVYRRYSRFFDLQTQLLDKFPIDAGATDPTLRIIPFLPGKIFFGRSQIRDVAMKRLGEIDEYCKNLLALPPHISQSEEVQEFFDVEPEDIDPPKEGPSKNKGERKADKISGPKRLEQYTALADYQPQDKGEMLLTTGMVVEVTEKSESGWWFVNAEDQQGWVPSTYLQALNGSRNSSASIFTDGAEKYICIEHFVASSDDEIALEKGVLVEVIQKSMDGWWRVRYQGKEGYAPATYLKKSSDPHARYMVDKSRYSGVQIIANLADVSSLMGGSSPRNSGVFAMSKAGHSTASEGATNETVPCESAASAMSDGLWDDDWDDDEEKDGYSMLSNVRAKNTRIIKQLSLERGGSLKPPPRQNSVTAFSPPVPPPLAQKSSTYVTVADFKDTVGDGISFSAGETVTVLEKTSTGWWFVQRGSEEGWVPETFLEPSTLKTEKVQTVTADHKKEEEGELEEKVQPHASGLASALNARLKGMNKSGGGGGDDAADQNPPTPFKLLGRTGGGVSDGSRLPPLPPPKVARHEESNEALVSNEKEAASALTVSKKSRFEPKIASKPELPVAPKKLGEKPNPPHKVADKPAPPMPPAGKFTGRSSPPVHASKPAENPKTGRPLSGAPFSPAGLSKALKSKFDSQGDGGDEKPSKPSLPQVNRSGPPPLPSKPTADSRDSSQNKPTAQSKPFVKSSIVKKPPLAYTEKNDDSVGGVGYPAKTISPKLPSGPPKLPSKPQVGSKLGSDSNNNNSSVGCKPLGNKVLSMAGAFGHMNNPTGNEDSAGIGTKPTLPSKKPVLQSQNPSSRTSEINIPGKPKVGNLVNELGSKLHFGVGGPPSLSTIGAASGVGDDEQSKIHESSANTRSSVWSGQQMESSRKSPESSPVKKSAPLKVGGAPRPGFPAPPPPSSQPKSMGTEYLVLGDFAAQGPGEVDLRDGDVVHVLDQEQESWWLVRLETGEEGWAPSTYLEPATQWDD